MVEGYCMRCKTKREMKETKDVTTANGRSATKGKCNKCDTNMYKINGKANGTSKKSKKVSKKKSKKGGSRKRRSKKVSKKRVSRKRRSKKTA